MNSEQVIETNLGSTVIVEVMNELEEYRSVGEITETGSGWKIKPHGQKVTAAVYETYSEALEAILRPFE